MTIIWDTFDTFDPDTLPDDDYNPWEDYEYDCA